MAAFVILGVAYSFATPIFEKNDEESHAWFVRHLAAGGDLPVQIPGQPESALQREGSQPPLYYWLAVPVMQLFDLSDFDAQMRPNQSPQFNPYAPNNKNLLIITPQKRAFAYENSTLAAAVLRLLGILPGCVTIWFVYAIAYAVSRDERLALLAMGLTAFNPMFIQVMTALGNDGLVIMLSTVALHVLIQGLLNGFSAARVLIGGIVIGLAALSKVSGTLLLPVAAVAILGREWQRPSSKKLARRLGAVAAQGLGIALLWGAISGWWYVRNLQLYGDLTGTSIMAQMMTPRNFTLLDALSEFEGFRMSYIAMFGQFAVPADGIVYLAFDALLILSGIGLAAWVWREARGKRPEARGQRSEDGSQTEEGEAQRSLRMLGVGVLGLYVVLLLASVLRWTMMTPASHGRLIFPGIAGVSTLMAMGLMQFRRSWWVPGVVLVPMLVVAAIAPFRYILPGYTPPLVSAAPSDLIPVQQRMGDLAEVVGYRMSPPDARPGDRVRVVVALRALRSERDDYSLVTKLYGRDNAQLARFDTFTGKGLWPSELWRAGDLMLDEVELTVPLTATAPGHPEGPVRAVQRRLRRHRPQCRRGRPGGRAALRRRDAAPARRLGPSGQWIHRPVRRLGCAHLRHSHRACARPTARAVSRMGSAQTRRQGLHGVRAPGSCRQPGGQPARQTTLGRPIPDDALGARRSICGSARPATAGRPGCGAVPDRHRFVRSGNRRAVAGCRGGAGPGQPDSERRHPDCRRI